MRVLVTGGAGFIGSNLVNALLSGGHVVGVIDDLSTGKSENIHPHAWFRTLDILDDSMPALVAEFAPDAVVHLAAQASVPVSLRDPERDFAVNAEGTRRVAAAAKAAGAVRMISASSAAVYGEPDETMLPLAESAPKAPVNPYGTSKLAAEGLLAEELLGTGVDFASFRFANVYGPRQDAAGEGGVVALFCAAMHAGEPPTVFGDGTQTRDFIYVGDIVGAIVAALHAEGTLGTAAGDAPAYNISTGRETNVNDILRSLREAAEYWGPIDSRPLRHGDVARSSLSPAKCAATFGWTANQTLDVGLQTTWRWFAGRA
ncbi:MAG: NAD-dependent epimerase/dehydratase family protein [Coriobacteriia bacterium]|nr:NAD-dependent epimerase/dehydratase family protein [Coriobacteriia bacterium]